MMNKIRMTHFHVYTQMKYVSVGLSRDICIHDYTYRYQQLVHVRSVDKLKIIDPPACAGRATVHDLVGLSWQSVCFF